MQKKTTKIHIHPTDIARWEYCNIQWLLEMMKKNQCSKQNLKSGSSRRINQIDTSRQNRFRDDTNET